MATIMPNRPVQIARGVLSPAAGSGEQSPPGSGATITIYDSTANTNNLQFNPHVPWSRIVLAVNSSHDGAANGVIFEGSEDNGANWDDMVAKQSYATASGLVSYDALVTAPQVRVRYINSANVLTRWRMSLMGITGDRSKGT